MHIYEFLYRYICEYIYVYICIHIYMYIYTCSHIYVYICTHIFAPIHTHIQVIVIDAKGKKAKSAKGGGSGFGAKKNLDEEKAISASAIPDGTEVLFFCT